MWKFIITAVVLYFLVRFVFRFVLPIVQVTKQAQSNINDLRSRMEAMQEQQGQSSQQFKSQSKNRQPIEGEYVDFEEVK